MTDAVIRAVMDLDHSYLFIQGPPGTGKTYTAAQAIIALLRAGKRVGVSSNSHKAINKLLLEVEKHAKTSGFPFQRGEKGQQGDPETEFNSLNITTMFDFEGRVAAAPACRRHGVPFLARRPARRLRLSVRR